jgi:hypothetical protein
VDPVLLWAGSRAANAVPVGQVAGLGCRYMEGGGEIESHSGAARESEMSSGSDPDRDRHGGGDGAKGLESGSTVVPECGEKMAPFAAGFRLRIGRLAVACEVVAVDAVAVAVGALNGMRIAGLLRAQSRGLCHCRWRRVEWHCRRRSCGGGWGRRSLGNSRHILSGWVWARGSGCVLTLGLHRGDDEVSERSPHPTSSRYRP